MSATPIPFVLPQDPSLSNQDLQEETSPSSTQSTINTKHHSYITATIHLLVVNDDSPFWSSDNIDQAVAIRLSPEQARRIHDIHALSPSIEQAVASLRLKKDYHYPRYITFTQHDSYKGETHLSIVAHAPSLKAWMNLLRDAKVGNKLPHNSPLHTLSAITIDDVGQDFGISGAVEKFTKLVDEIRVSERPLIRFPKLTSVQALIAPNSAKIFSTFSVLFKSNALTATKSLDLQFAKGCQPLRQEDGKLLAGNISAKNFLSSMYSLALENTTFAQLTAWHAVSWGDLGPIKIRDTLAAQKSSLTSLIVDDVFSGKKVDHEITRQTRT